MRNNNTNAKRYSFISRYYYGTFLNNTLHNNINQNKLRPKSSTLSTISTSFSSMEDIDIIEKEVEEEEEKKQDDDIDLPPSHVVSSSSSAEGGGEGFHVDVDLLFISC